MYFPNVGSLYPIWLLKKYVCYRTLRCIVSTELYSQNVGNSYPIQIYISKCTFPNPAPNWFAETLKLTYIFPKCRQNISNKIYILGNIYICIPIWLRNTCQLYLYIGIGHIMPTLGGGMYVGGFLNALRAQGNIFLLDIFCQQFWEYMSVEYICWYWIYHANTWGMNVSWRVSVRPLGAGLGNVHF